MNKLRTTLFTSAALLLLSYTAWATIHILRLNARVVRLEESHRFLTACTYDLGSALTGPDPRDGLSSRERAVMPLAMLRLNDLTRSAVESDRNKQILIDSLHSPRNSVKSIDK